MKLPRAVWGLTFAAAVSPVWGQAVMGEGGGLGGGKSQGKGGAMGACQDDTDKFCSDQRGKGHDAVQACLKKHLKEISADCKKHLKPAKPHSKKAKTAAKIAAPDAASTLPPPGSGQ